MRQLFTLVAGLVSVLLAAQTKKTVESKIEKVTVFLEGAQVERSAKTALTPGKYELVFDNISPSIDKQSIQVKADGNITVLSVIYERNFMKEQQKQQEISELETQQESQLDKITLQKNILNVYKQEETMLIKNQQIGGANSGLKAVDLKEAVDFQRSRLTEVYQKQMETDKEIKKMEAGLAKINNQLAELKQKADISTSEIYVTVNAKENTTSNFALTYLVKQSGWYPTYDIRVKDISSPINLQYKANVFQSSGEDWKNIKLSLSTGNPNENGNKPVISPWYLRYVYNTLPLMIRGISSIQSDYVPGSVSGTITDENGGPVAGATIFAKGTKTAAVSNGSGFFSLVMPAGANTLAVSSVGYATTETPATAGIVNIKLRPSEQSLNEVVVIGYSTSNDENYNYSSFDKSYKKKKEETAINTTTSYQPTTTMYEIEDPYTVLNDGKTYTVDINGYEVNALYEYYAAPRLDPDAFLTAKIVDWQELNLLPGEANLFFEGTFLGKSILDVANAGDTLKLSLGKDKGVVVKRTLLKEFSTKKLLGSNKTDSRQYEIAVRNNKQQLINIIVEDQFPISTQKEIEIQDRKYEGAKIDDDTQRITWQFAVDPKKENKVNFKYEVKYPREKVLQLD
jgi:Domain of unknown function (DUF4139)/N-terminal domain of unknown function (DUF4140)